MSPSALVVELRLRHSAALVVVVNNGVQALLFRWHQ